MDPTTSSPPFDEADQYSDNDVYMDSEGGSCARSSDAMSESGSSTRTLSTLYPGDSISQRPADSVTSESLSVKSIHKDEDDLFRTAFGRTFNAECDSYLLPADGVEHSPHDVQHRILQLTLNSLYMPVELVKRALAPSFNWEFPAVFDVGTGSGRWALDIALEFPHCEVIGLDLVPPSLGRADLSVPVKDRIVPLNCRFEVDDANLSLSHYANSFNVVHSRAIDPGISNFESYLYNIARTLRPHGVLLLCSGTPQLYDETLEPCRIVDEGMPGFSYLQWFWAAVYAAYLNLGSTTVDAAIYWDDLLQVNPNYENVTSRDVYIPIGPWPKGMDELQTYVAELMRWNMINISVSYEALLIADGHEPDMVERLIKNSRRELAEMTSHTYIRWRYTWAERCDSEWEEQLERPPLDESTHPPLFATKHI